MLSHPCNFIGNRLPQPLRPQHLAMPPMRQHIHHQLPTIRIQLFQHVAAIRFKRPALFRVSVLARDPACPFRAEA